MNLELETLISLLVGFLGMTFALIAIVLHFAGRRAREERSMALIREGIERFNKKSEEMLDTAKQIVQSYKDASFSQHLRPELSIFVTRQWAFVEKTFHNRFEKHSICRRIVTKHISENAAVLLDSGSTIDLITFELLSSPDENIRVLSNNIFAAMHLIGTKRITFRLLPGVFNDRFAATYSDDSNSLIMNHDFSVIILAATAFKYNNGIMVHKGDRENTDFKACALRNFDRSSSTKLIIAIDATKIFQDIDKHQASCLKVNG